MSAATVLTDEHRKKQTFTGDIEKIPGELRRTPRWLLWEYTVVNGDIKKLPKRDSGTGKAVPASVTDRDHWRGFAETLQYARSHKMGVGFVLTADDDVMSIDLDHCVCPDGTLTAKAQEIVSHFEKTYIEMSPSGTGLHVWVRGSWPSDGSRSQCKTAEVYKNKRFLTISGLPWHDAPAELTDCTEGLAWLKSKFWPDMDDARESRSPQGSAGLGSENDYGSFSTTLSDETLLEKAMSAKDGERFRDLWEGRWQGSFPSQSEADGSLICRLVFWSRDPEQIDRLFRQSGLMRGKWDEMHGVETYGVSTIRTALERVSNTYAPHVAIRENSPMRCTDVSAARIFAKLHGCETKFCEALGWLIWDGRRWLRDDSQHVTLLARSVSRHVLGLASKELDGERRKVLARWAVDLESEKKIRAMLSLAQSEPGIVCRGSDFDTDPMALSVRNGVLDLRSGELRRHDPEDLITKLADVAYDPAAKCPRWTQFIEEVTCGDVALASFLQGAVGYSATGDTSEQIMFFSHGQGSNGKSIFANVIEAVLGDYATTCPFESLLVERFARPGGQRSDLLRLRGARFVHASESSEGGALSTSMLKQLTGQDSIAVRGAYEKNYVEYRPEFKLWVSGNYKPVIRDDSTGMWRRMRLLPWNASFTGSKCDPKLEGKLLAEAPGILRWIVAGAQLWLSQGLPAPEIVTRATAEFRAEASNVTEFLATETVQDPSAATSMLEFYASYSAWCRLVCETPVSKQMLGRTLERFGFERRHRKQGSLYAGIRLGRPKRSETPQEDEVA